MSVNLTINGVTYAYPQTGDRSWGSDATGWAQAVTAGVLQKAGGTFALTAEVDFGATYGLKTAYYKSQTANPASAGQLRLGNTDTLAWRNAANSGDITLSVDGSDEWNFNGTALTTTELGYLAGVTSSIQTQFTGKLSDVFTTDGDILIENTGYQRLAIGSQGQKLTVSSGALPAWENAYNPSTSTVSGNVASTTSWADTGHSVTVTVLTGENVFLSFCGFAINDAVALTNTFYLAYSVDGAAEVPCTAVSVAGASQIASNMSFSLPIIGLSAGSRTIKLRLKHDSTRAWTLYGTASGSSANMLAISKF